MPTTNEMKSITKMKISTPHWAIALTIILAHPLLAQDDDKEAAPKPASVAGTWTWMAQGFGGEREVSATFKQEGPTISGTYDGGFGETAIESGKVEGDAVAFEIVRRFGDNEYVTSFSGKVSGDTIKGSIESEGRDGPQTNEWMAYKAPEIDPTGLWKWSVTRGGGGQARDQWVKLDYDKGTLSGVYRSSRSRAPISEAKLDGKDLSFVVERGGFRGRDRKTVYKGTLSAEGIKGTIVSQGRNGERETEWTATRVTPDVEPQGTWAWTSRSGRDGEERENVLMLSKGDDGYAGTLDGRWGKADLENVKVSDDVVTYAVTNENDRGSFTSTYKAKIDEDTLEGTSTIEFGERQFTRPFSATRKLPQAEPVGVWKWETRGFRRGGQESEPRENTLTLAKDDGTLTGTITGRGGETEISEAKLEGNKLTFKVEREFNGNSLTLNYRAQIRGDRLTGGYSVGDSDWETIWEAERGE